MERMHNSNLHVWGIARGLEVSGTIDGTEIIINPGVAIDIKGNLISLPNNGYGYTGKLKPDKDVECVLVPVVLSTEDKDYAEKMVYVTIKFLEIVQKIKQDSGEKNSSSSNVDEQEMQVPWLRLQPVNNYKEDDEGKSIILAIAKIDKDEKLVELKAKDSTLPYYRHLIGESIEELQIRRSSNVGDKVQDILSGRIGPGDEGGLKITVPGAADSISFTKEGGGDFESLEIKANVGIGKNNPKEKLEVNGTVTATEFKGKGSSITDLDCTNITLGTINDALISGNISRETRFDPTSGHKHTGNPGDGPKISHKNLIDNAPVNPALTDDDRDKHVSNALAKGWQDHVTKTGNPHGTTATDVGALPITGGTINGKVGIGTLDPGAALHIDKGDLNQAALKLSSTSEGWGSGIIFKNGSKEYGIYVGNDNIFKFSDINQADNRLVIDPSGNVGIGPTFPSEKLVVAGNIKIIGQEDNEGLCHSKFSIIAGYCNGTESKVLNFDSLMQGNNCISRSVTVGDDWTFNAKLKNFLIDHPLYPDTHNLVHSSLEGPEIAVFYRGESQLSNGEATVSLPDYFEKLTRKENRTVLLTPKFEDSLEISMLATSDVKEGKFTVKMIDSKNPSQRFYWEVKAIRADIEILEVEMKKIPVK